MWFPLLPPLLGTWPATRACALTGNQTGDPLVHRPTLNQLSHTSWGSLFLLITNNPFTWMYGCTSLFHSPVEGTLGLFPVFGDYE